MPPSAPSPLPPYPPFPPPPEPLDDTPPGMPELVASEEMLPPAAMLPLPLIVRLKGEPAPTSQVESAPTVRLLVRVTAVMEEVAEAPPVIVRNRRLLVSRMVLVPRKPPLSRSKLPVTSVMDLV